MRKNIFVPDKLAYIRGKKTPRVDCIICSVLSKDPRVECLLIWEDELCGVSANLYPYNAGHLLIFPKRHILDLREMSSDEAFRLSEITKGSLDILDKIYEPAGYNIGFNIGDASGASVAHLHQHLVPRYPKELGFMDIMAGTKIIIESPQETMKKLKKGFASFSPGRDYQKKLKLNHKDHKAHKEKKEIRF